LFAGRDPNEASPGSDVPRRIGAVSFRIFSMDEPSVAQDPWRSLNDDAKAIPAEEASLALAPQRRSRTQLRPHQEILGAILA
jgi:hypothetical protein